MPQEQARYFTVLAGIWLFASAFLWPHTGAQFANSWIVGVVTSTTALLALSAPWARFVNTTVGFWLIISSFLLPIASRGTLWNNLIVGLIVMALSLVGPIEGRRGTTGRRGPLGTPA